MKFSAPKFFLLLILSAVAWWAWKRATNPPPTIISGYVLTADGNRPIKGAWVVPAAYIEQSVIQFYGGYMIDYSSGCGPAAGVQTDANGQFFATIPDSQIHIDDANTSTPGIAYVYALGYETVTMHPTKWKTPILMKPTGKTLDDVIREAKKMTVGPCPVAGTRHTAESEMGAAIFEQKLTRFCATAAPTVDQLNYLDMGLVGGCERKRSNANARACLKFYEVISEVRTRAGYGLLSAADRQIACSVATEFLTEVTND